MKQDQPHAAAQTDQPCSICIYREVSHESIAFSPCYFTNSVRGPGTILKELWTEEVSIPEVKTSYEEELQKSQKRYKKCYDKKAKPRRLERGDQVPIWNEMNYLKTVFFLLCNFCTK